MVAIRSRGAGHLGPRWEALLLEGVQQALLVLSAEGLQQGHAVEEQLHLPHQALLRLLHVVPARQPGGQAVKAGRFNTARCSQPRLSQRLQTGVIVSDADPPQLWNVGLGTPGVLRAVLPGQGLKDQAVHMSSSFILVQCLPGR
jgi:hypothetical protein